MCKVIDSPLINRPPILECGKCGEIYTVVDDDAMGTPYHKEMLVFEFYEFKYICTNSKCLYSAKIEEK